MVGKNRERYFNVFGVVAQLPEHLKPGGVTQSIEILTWKWKAIDMDFIVGLTKTRNMHDSIWVIVDKMTMYAHFIPVKSTYMAEDYAKLYIDEIVWLHMISLSIS